MFIKLRRILRLGRREEGAAAVEFAIILPVLATLILGGMDMAHMFYIEHIATNASREGARYAARYTGALTPPTSDQVSTYVKTTLDYNSFHLKNFNVAASYEGASPSQIVTVTANADKNWWILAGLLGSTKTCTGTTAMTVEAP